MRGGGLIAVATLLAISCSNPSPVVSGSSPTPSASPSATPSTTPTATSYGLLWLPGKLQMITPSGTVAATANMASPSRHLCGNGYVAGLQPPVSASADRVYFRDGDTAIRYLTPDGQVGDATTVPGSGSKLSFFSVSPDDRRIAVMVEDFSLADRLNLTLYVEDLIGHGNHKVIYTNSTSRYVTGRTLWPMGWHKGLLVLGVFPSCTAGQDLLIPTEWHVSSPITGARVAKIGNPCEPSYWPSPAGVVCLQRDKTPEWTFDWSGKLSTYLNICPAPSDGAGICGVGQSGLSPSGQSFFLTPNPGRGKTPATEIITLPRYQSAIVAGHSACLWIDENHLLAPDAIIRLEPPGGSDLTAVTPLSAGGVCAGRFPGGL